MSELPIPFTRRRLAGSLYRELQAAGRVDRESVRLAMARTAAAAPYCPQDELLAALADAMLRLISREPDLFWRDPPRAAAPLLSGARFAGS